MIAQSMWHGFSGEAVATLWGAIATGTTGLLAVGGAIVVGLKQAGISRRQTEIMEVQGEIERKRVAHELYERRYEVYRATDVMLTDAVRRNCVKPSEETQAAFFRATQEAYFLFPKPTQEAIQRLQSDITTAFMFKWKIERNKESSERVDPDDKARWEVLHKQLFDQLLCLHEMFPELVLY